MPVATAEAGKAQTSASPSRHYRYRLEFQPGDDVARFPGDRVDPAYLSVPREQAIFRGQRAGLLGDNPAEASVLEQPVFTAEATGEIAGLQFLVGEGESTLRVLFDVQAAFGAAAQAQLARFQKQEAAWAKCEKVLFRVYAEADDNGRARAGCTDTPHVRRKPLPVQDGVLGEWLAVGQPVGPVSDRHYPLFIYEETLEKAQAYLGKAGSQKLEGAALLLGHLYRQREPVPELFGVVDAAIEIRHADQKAFSFTPTAAGYADLGAQMALRRTRLGRTHEVPLILAHNHWFYPAVQDDGDAHCPSCEKRRTCEMTSSFYSRHDVNLHLSWFGSQPYVAGMVIGLTPRDEQDLRVFAMHGCLPEERGFYKIAERATR